VDSEVIVRTGGGGGWGDPLDRDPEMVRGDVIEGFVSAEKALSEYAVVLNPQNSAVDVAATQLLRATAKSKRKVEAGEERS
jgi:N-methylhydantoinase B